jgi:hypothetical protein
MIFLSVALGYNFCPVAILNPNWLADTVGVVWAEQYWRSSVG